LINKSFVDKNGLSNRPTAKNLLTSIFTLKDIAKFPKVYFFKIWLLGDCVESFSLQEDCVESFKEGSTQSFAMSVSVKIKMTTSALKYFY
jgi:hypothetical protein